MHLANRVSIWWILCGCSLTVLINWMVFLIACWLAFWGHTWLYSGVIPSSESRNHPVQARGPYGMRGTQPAPSRSSHMQGKHPTTVLSPQPLYGGFYGRIMYVVMDPLCCRVENAMTKPQVWGHLTLTSEHRTR